MEHSVFISYHHDSSVQLVERIVQALESSGIKCWYAPRDVQSKYAGDIVRAIEECKVFLLVMNRYSTHSEHVLNEIDCAFNLMKAYLPTSKTPIRTGKKVAVVGGGNVAMDAARSALRLGAETVYIVYRRGMAELPARKEEVEHAEEEGIIFKTLCNPVEIHANDEGFVKSITCIEMELGEPDASGRRRPIEKKGSEFELDVDTVIMSLGTSPNPLIRSTTPGLETNKHGCIVTDGDDGKTSRDGVYAGGDAVTGAATVIKAMGAGKAAAKAIDEYIQSK